MNSKFSLIILQLYLFISLFSLILSESKDLALNKTVHGVIYKDNSFNYYKLILPSTIKKNKLILVFTVKESRQGLSEGEDLFSDPDIQTTLNGIVKNMEMIY